MQKYIVPVMTILIAGILAAMNATITSNPYLAADDSAGLATVEESVARIAQIKGATPEETNRLRNQELNGVFQQFVRDSKKGVSVESIREFHALVKKHGMSSFDDFCEAMLAPVRYVTGRNGSERVPVFGALGSDIINPWLAAMGVTEGKPLEEQPMYKLACDVLREQLDFAIIGVRDPNLSFDLIPPELHANARWAYARLNPTNKFEGGFDQPLYYITIREAAKKLFRVDYPDAKLTMADVVLSEEKGGLGIRSCLLCHNRDYTDVYARLLGQSNFYRNKAADETAAVSGTAQSSEVSAEAKEAADQAEMFQLAATRVLDVHGSRIDVQAARSRLGSNSVDVVGRLLPGFDEFYEQLDTIGCTMCHSSTEQPDAEHDPAKFGAFVLTPNNYFKAKNVKALLDLIDRESLDNSKLLVKAGGKVKHRGADELQLNAAEFGQLKEALYQWVHSLDR